MPVPSRLQDAPLTRRTALAGAVLLLAAAVAGVSLPGVAATRTATARAEGPPFGQGDRSAQGPPSGVAWFVRRLDTPRERREARPDILDAPQLPGSLVKAVTLVTALESGVLRPDTGAMCRRVVTVDGVRFTCAHPDLGRPLTPAEALAHSCNDFFVTLARRLSRDGVNRTRLAAGLPPLPSSAALAPSLVGLDGPRVTPRALIDVLARLAGVGPDPPVPMSGSTRAVLLEGLSGAATFGTASALGARGVSAWAKTGTAPMPGGGVAGLVVALAPAGRPTYGVVVVAPGGAGADAAGMAADLLAQPALVPASPEMEPRGEPTAPPTASSTIRLGRTSSDGRIRVETLDLDDYVAEVLAGEGQPRAAAAAHEALAVTARTFALANPNRHRREGFDVCDTTHCQVVRPATPTTRQAARATSGRVLLTGGEPASVFYSAWCGGRVERASAVWPGAEDFSHPATDDACTGEPSWESEVRVGEVERALRAAGLRGGRLRGLRVLQRNSSGRVIRLRAEGFTPPDISGHDFRMAMGRVGGWQLVKSTGFEVQRTGAGYRFRGRGFGHGVGLCVVGAGVRASRGSSAADILRFYFPTLSVGTAARSANARPEPMRAGAGTAPANGRAAGAAATGAADVQVALPAAEEGERRSLASLVRRARDEVAAATGQAAPPTLRITVHPTVESFGRATGQPWWVSGATVGTSIDLLSLQALSRRGILEQTVRHEVAHAVLDGALAGRALWVREGAAIFFSREGDGEVGNRSAGTGNRESRVGSRESASRAPCPTDEEIRRPVSAGAQRDAYQRAAACFGRALAAGTRWSDVR